MDIQSIQKAVGMMYNENEKNSTLGCTLLVSGVGFVNMLRELLNKLPLGEFLNASNEDVFYAFFISGEGIDTVISIRKRRDGKFKISAKQHVNSVKGNFLKYSSENFINIQEEATRDISALDVHNVNSCRFIKEIVKRKEIVRSNL